LKAFFKPFVDVSQQSIFGVVHPDSSGNVHCRNQDHAFPDPALVQRALHLCSDVDELPMFLSIKGQMFCVEMHTVDDSWQKG